MYSGSSDGSIKVWDVSDLRKGCLKTVVAHKDCVSPFTTLCMVIHLRPRESIMIMFSVVLYNYVVVLVYFVLGRLRCMHLYVSATACCYLFPAYKSSLSFMLC